MPRLTITADEIIDFVKQRQVLPDRIREIRREGDEIHLKVNVVGPLSAAVKISVAGYADGRLTLTMHTDGLTGALAQGLALFRELGDGFELNWPQLKINLHQLLRKYAGSFFNGYPVIQELKYHDGEFRIDFTV